MLSEDTINLLQYNYIPDEIKAPIFRGEWSMLNYYMSLPFKEKSI
jgi:hypothetical protein